MALVLDASVAISWCFPGDSTEDTPFSRRVLDELAESDAVVPEIWAFEVANAIFVASMKRGRITEQQVQVYLRLLKALPIRVEPQAIWANLDLEALARMRNIAAYDAAYLDLARRTGLPLATSDGPLKAAASAAGITLYV
jgi:predicted nucleic acid-binding protein